MALHVNPKLTHLQGGVYGVPDEAGDGGPHAPLQLQSHHGKAIFHQTLKQGPIQIIPSARLNLQSKQASL